MKKNNLIEKNCLEKKHTNEGANWSLRNKNNFRGDLSVQCYAFCNDLLENNNKPLKNNLQYFSMSYLKRFPSTYLDPTGAKHYYYEIQ